MIRSRAAALPTPCRRSGRYTLPNTVCHGISVGSWKTKPISPSGSPLALIFEDGHSTVPEEAAPSPAMILSAVDLPQPEGPSRLMNSPEDTLSDMSESATVPFENTFDTWLMVTTVCDGAAVAAAATRGASAMDKSVNRQNPG